MKDALNTSYPTTLIWEGRPDEYGLCTCAWLGSKWAAQDRDWLEANIIGMVQSAVAWPLVGHRDQHPMVAYLPTIDINSYVAGTLSAESLLQQLYRFDLVMEQCAALGQGALIACMQGANRSAILAVAFLCAKTGAGVRHVEAPPSHHGPQHGPRP